MQDLAKPTNKDLNRKSSKSKTSILLALAVALIVHLLVLLVPLSTQVQESVSPVTVVELQLTAFEPPQKAEESTKPEVISDPVPAPLPESLPEPEPVETPLPAPLDEVPENIASTQPKPTLTPINRDIERMTHQQKTQLTHSILSRQFISEPTAAEQLFGKPVPSLQPDPVAEFHYPMRESMVTMLDKPMQDLPFEYKQGLVYFAYEPGVKGDLQKFWDDITPEFGWITRYGTEVKCVLVLVIVGCAWK